MEIWQTEVKLCKIKVQNQKIKDLIYNNFD